MPTREPQAPTFFADPTAWRHWLEAAWAFFQSRPPSYRRTAIWWVVSAKQEATRHRRLATRIDDSAHGRTLARLTPKRT